MLEVKKLKTWTWVIVTFWYSIAHSIIRFKISPFLASHQKNTTQGNGEMRKIPTYQKAYKALAL